MWNIRLVVRQNLNIYRGFCSFMHIYASCFMLCTALHCQPCRFATILFRRCRLTLAAKTDLSLRQSLCVSRATGVPVQRFALNSSIDLLFALTADAFCLRRIFAEPRIAARPAVFVGARLHSVFPRSYSLFFDFSISFCLMPHGAPQPFCLFFSASGFSRFPFDDPLRIFARL